MKISNAKDMKLSETQSALPDVAAAVQEILQPLRIIVYQKQQINGYTQEIPREFSTRASIQPLTPQQIKMLPEGQRAWKYFTMYCERNIQLLPDDGFKIRGVRYRVQDKTDWKEFGYIKYDCIEDYSDSPDVSGD
jgi:hypothetical protein